MLQAERERFRHRLDIGAEAEIGGKLHRVAAAVWAHMDDAPGQLFQHRPRALDILEATADHGEQRAGLHLWDGAEHRRLDQPRAARFDQRHKLAAGHRLQRAHLDEQLARDVAFKEPGGAGENLSHAVVFGDAGNDDVGDRGNAAGIGGDTQPVRGQRLVRFGVLVPAGHVKTLLAQAAGYCRAHAAEADNAKFHQVLPMRRTFDAQ